MSAVDVLFTRARAQVGRSEESNGGRRRHSQAEGRARNENDVALAPAATKNPRQSSLRPLPVTFHMKAKRHYRETTAATRN
jgi:hypothetical protein